MCIVLCCILGVGAFVVSYIGCKYMYYVVHPVQMYVLYCTLCVDVCVVMYIVYVYMIEENKKALGLATNPVCVYGKDEGRSEGLLKRKVSVFYFSFIMHVIYDSDL